MLWQIVKKYDNEVLEDNEKSLGVKIDVYMDSGKLFGENLVNFDYFDNEMNKNGLFLVDNQEIEELGLKEKGFDKSSGMFSDVYDNIIKNADIKKQIDMTSDEKRYSFLDRYFIYKKKHPWCNKYLRNNSFLNVSNE